LYELLPGEGLPALIEQYGGGFTLNADSTRINLARIDTPEGIPGETLLFSYKENTGMKLQDRDVINVTNKSAARPVVFFRGAISATLTGLSAVEETSEEIEGTSKMEYPFYEGETLGNAARAISGLFTASSDLENAYVIRGDRQIGVDLRSFIYNNDFSHDMALEAGDIIIIPFYQFFVLVSGAVNAPGRYPYVPDRQADYYINLAGGRNELLNNGRGMKITDINNKAVADSAIIQPESMIYLPTNAFTAKFNQYGPVITTILSIISATISIMAITGLLN
jgi:protein involved in polysaccharide export with SLBB domain